MELQFSIKHQNLIRTDTSRVVEKSRNYLYAVFNFSEEWTGVIKTASFRHDKDVSYDVILNESETCKVPWEVIREGQIHVSVYGGDLITTNIAVIDVEQSGYAEGEEPGEPTPDVYTQILKIIETGEIQGTAGPEGPQGPRGDRGEAGAKGDPGDNGITPVKGVDYFTEEDLADLPYLSNSSPKLEAPLDAGSFDIADAGNITAGGFIYSTNTGIAGNNTLEEFQALQMNSMVNIFEVFQDINAIKIYGGADPDGPVESMTNITSSYRTGLMSSLRGYRAGNLHLPDKYRKIMIELGATEGHSIARYTEARLADNGGGVLTVEAYEPFSSSWKTFYTFDSGKAGGQLLLYVHEPIYLAKRAEAENQYSKIRYIWQRNPSSTGSFQLCNLYEKGIEPGIIVTKSFGYDGNGTLFSKGFNAQGWPITSVGDPFDDGDAVNLKYFKEHSGGGSGSAPLVELVKEDNISIWGNINEDGDGYIQLSLMNYYPSLEEARMSNQEFGYEYLRLQNIQSNVKFMAVNLNNEMWHNWQFDVFVYNNPMSEYNINGMCSLVLLKIPTGIENPMP